MNLQNALTYIQARVDRLTEEFKDFDWHEMCVSYNPERGEYQAYIQGCTAREGGLKTDTDLCGHGDSYAAAIIDLGEECAS